MTPNAMPANIAKAPRKARAPRTIRNTQLADLLSQRPVNESQRADSLTVMTTQPKGTK